MIKRLVVLVSFLASAALLLPGSVRAQCSNGPCYTANPPAVTRLTPAQAVAQGNVAVTMNVDTLSNTYSHSATIGAGTNMGINYNARCPQGHQCSVAFQYSTNGGARYTWGTQPPPPPAPLNGTFYYNFATWAGYVFQGFTIATDNTTGTSTTDIITITVTSQAPGIYTYDQLPENKYLHFHSSGGGGSMLSDFTMCQLDPRHCINATHTPYTTLAISNLMSGEAQSHLKHVSGNIAKQNESVSFSDDMFFSALPEDVFTYSEDDEVDCSISGPVGVPPVKMDIRFERAITEEYISSIINSNGMHPEHIYCIIAATPPDFPGADEALPGTPSGQVVNIAFLYREWPINTQEKGVQWQLVFPDIQEFGIGYYVKTTMEPDPSGCTMWDNGFRHLPLPTPLDPQPQ